MGVPVPKIRGRLQAYQAFVLLRCVIAMNIVVPLTTELSLLQRRGGARNTQVNLIWNVLRKAVLQSDWCCMIFCSRTNA